MMLDIIGRQKRRVEMNEIAIIIPGYNCEKYIQKCLKSIFLQKYNDYTIFFIDDGSTDSTKDIVTSIRNEHLIYKYQLNAGVSVSRNMGLHLAKEFEYIMFIDADDWLEEGALEIAARCIEQSNKADFILFDWNEYRIREGEKECVYCKMNNNFTTNITMESLRKHMARSRAGGSPWGKLFKNKVITEYGLEFIANLPYAEDYLFNLSFILNAENIFYCPRAIYGYNCYQSGARAKFRKNLMDIYMQIEDEKFKLFSATDFEYSGLLKSELLEQLSIALLNLRNVSFSSEERKNEKNKAKQFLRLHHIRIGDVIKSNTNIKVKTYVAMFMLGLLG